MRSVHERRKSSARFVDFETRHEVRAQVFKEAPLSLFHGPDGAAGFEGQLRQVAEMLDMDLVLLGHVNETVYTTVAFYSRTGDPSITKGDTIPIGETYCRQEIAATEPFVLRDAVIDPIHGTVFADHPGFRVHGLRAYAGAPIRLSDGTVFGTLCGVDGCARPIAKDALEKLAVIAGEVAQELDRRLEMREK